MKGFWIAFLVIMGITPFFGYVGSGAAALVFTIGMLIGIVSTISSYNTFDQTGG